ncbi:pyruvate dehydrogenase e1 component alphasubunit [Lichtheimia corymbifera JMRC:FSU:9682]|uniref:Pyruvate dehydrogenase E1 component subunit alpha n=2 Tax=Lichtheimia TaxID=688353 RepID=A0A068RYI7_9FUNG|nr:pyruvate dehydrogenase (acetyl-transferring) E1 component, alpha subunit [Lichtheimia ornata]KAJ8655304.1 pyruvate dehydrogenase (acetyl-transferring) E1 component, alpha subunit [Lichtheimia ornata]CDH55044.1 pyruvate dehydrogenase e1 component alphasubunit [Lichtheimia corymbifera JMRC:FSU:9682]
MLRTAAARFLANATTAPKPFLPVRAFSSSASSWMAAPTDASEKLTITLPESSFDMFKADAPNLDVEISKEQLMDMYTKMTTMRRMEMAADGLYKAKKIRGFCHLCNGQEAVSVGMESAITLADQVITAYRCHGFTYVRGGSIKSILAELMGRKDGISKGKGGSMHMFAPSFFGGNGIVGAQVPLGAGMAFAQKYLGNESVTFALYGDGASNQGQVFEAFNMAKLWDLPCVFVCENNKYGMGTSANRSSASTLYHTRGDYIPGIRVNGMDVLAVYRACQWAKEWTTSGKGPLVMELTTYRYGGHSMSDPGTTYRTREEIQHMRSTADPIQGLKARLLDLGVATEEQLKAIDKEARKIVDQAVKEAEASPEPDMKEFYTQVYIEGSEPKSIRGREPGETKYF